MSLEVIDPEDLDGAILEEDFGIIEPFVGGIVKAESYAALKAAYAKVFSEVKAKEMNDFAENGKAPDVFEFAPSVSIKEAGGEIILTVVHYSNVKGAYGDYDYIDDYSCTITRTISCKNGMISGLSVKANMNATLIEDTHIGNEETDTPTWSTDVPNYPEYEESVSVNPGYDETEPEHEYWETDKDAWNTDEDVWETGAVIWGTDTGMWMPDDSYVDSGAISVEPPVYDSYVTVVPAKNYADTVIATKSEKTSVALSYDISYRIGYEFDKAGFDAIEIKDANVDTSTPEFDDNELIVHIGEDLRTSVYVYDINQDTDDFVNDYIIDQITHQYGYDYVQGEFDEWYEKPNVVINGLYKDAALTQRIDTSSITVEELVKLGDVYADYKIADGFAIIIDSFDTSYEYSLDYQIVLFEHFASYYDDYEGEGALVNVSEPYYFGRHTDTEGVRILVNGGEVKSDRMYFESGKTYEIEYVTVYTDKEFDAIDIFQDLFPR